VTSSWSFIVQLRTVSNTEDQMTVFQQDVGLPNIPTLLGWEFMTLARITVASLRLKQMVQLCCVRKNLQDNN